MPTERDNEMNTIWSELTMPVQNAILKANLAAKELVKFRDRHSWLEIGEGLHDIREEARHRADTSNIHHPNYRYYYKLLLDKVPDLKSLDEHDHAGCHHAVWMFENWQEVESFLADLGVDLKINHPSAIRRRHDGATKRKPQGLEKPQTKSMRQMARIDELQDEVRELHAELRDAPSSTTTERVPVTERYQVVRAKSRVLPGAPVTTSKVPMLTEDEPGFNPLPELVVEELADALQVTEENLDQLCKLIGQVFVDCICDNPETAKTWVRINGIDSPREFLTALIAAFNIVVNEDQPEEVESGA